MAVKTMRYEVVGWQGDPKDARARWLVIADACREIVNVFWQQWEVWHIAHGSDVAVREWLEEYKAAKEAKQKAPKCPVQPMTSELAKVIRRAINSRFPGVHSRVKDLLQQITTKKLTGKDVDGRWQIWMAILLNRQGRPNSTHDQPIPFDSSNSKPLELIDGKFTNYSLAVNLTRLPSENKNSPSIEDRVQLKARGSGHAIMRRIVDGEYKFCGSSLVFNSSRRKWFALVAYNDNAEVQPFEKAKGTAILHPRRTSPWSLRIGGRSRWMGGRGYYVSSARQRLLTGRWSRQENYRYAGSSNKGRGRRRAMQGVQKLSEAWKDFVKTCNHRLTKEVVDWCVEKRVARLVYFQPVDERRDSRFLTNAGKIAEREDSTGWDWAQVGTMLAYKCAAVGVHLEIRKRGVASGGEKQGGKSLRKVNRSRKTAAVLVG